MTSRTGPSARRAGLLITAILASLAMIGPFTIDTVFPAFASMGRDFDASTAAMQQVTSIYLISFAVMSILHGPLSDTLGRKPVMLTGLGLYVLATIGCALSPSLPVLLAFRALQGACAGAATIVSRAVIRDLYSGPEAHRLMSQVMMIFSIAPAIAPVAGGLLLAWGPWPIIFWAIAGYGVAIAVATAIVLPETLPPQDRQPLRLASIVAGLLEVARHPGFGRLALATTFVFAAQFVYIVSAPIMMVDLLGKGEQDFWILFAPLITGMMLGAWLSGRLAGRVDTSVLVDRAVLAALIAAGLNLTLMLTVPTLPWAVLGPACIAFAVAIAFPVLQLAMLDLFPHHRGSAASLATFASLVFNALLAGAISPLVTGSLTVLALSSTVFAVVGAGFWLLHRRLESVAGPAVSP
ncbi:multidrug effflux MFS transporter [Ornithinimicrobium faecis]|uniref:Multidrug effflux MFS transporter n=1 Tax=Ornithinimicrobium faecis TaxID=2934158 RepID=A0ABY4YNA6_9MICO|nr:MULTISPECIES: multidrug effflux MFS transporter [unclassified Ornithinimicrobium]USQ78164.1 multidrug effflux MFS transporter [Ornithinimicrobium sp. HY1793]